MCDVCVYVQRIVKVFGRFVISQAVAILALL